MTEETIFAAALELQTPAERAAYLDQACGENAALRRRIEALLRSNDDARFLKAPVVQRAVEILAGTPDPEATQGETVEAEEEAALLALLAPSEQPGSLGRLGHYEVREVIGRGGMGVVLRAFDEKLHRVVAIKMMATQLAATSPPRKRFLREARTAAAVRHENVVAIYAVEEQPIPYLVMEYVPGETLQQRLDRLGPLGTEEVLRVGGQIARGLAAAHSQGLVHRDIKPANVLLEGGIDGRAKITDFGLARAADDASLTQSGVIAGTPMYMAPEQARGETVDQRADLFSLGSLLYTLCAGRPPFRAANPVAVLRRVAEDTPRSLREIIPEVPEWLCALIAKLHAKNPEDRFQSAAEVADLLDRCLTALQQHGRVEGVPGLPAASATAAAASARARPALRRRWVAAAAVLLSLLGGLGITEATGVSKIRATVIRVFRPEGTLVVEADDPDVKVTVEGDGGLVITGPGSQEVRLRPGSYQVKATKDGKPVPLDRDLVAISRGGREIVRVRVEGAVPASALAPAERGAFVVLGGKGVAERKFDTLAEAVAGASDGDTIEVRGNGPFPSEPIRIGNQALAIRAGAGFRPVLRLSAQGAQGFEPLIRTRAPLVLEGLELQRLDQKPWKEGVELPVVLSADGPSLRVANCRIRVGEGTIGACIADRTHDFVARNCELVSQRAYNVASHPEMRLGRCRKITFENSVLIGGNTYFRGGDNDDDLEIRLRRNTFAHPTNIEFLLEPVAEKLDRRPTMTRVDASENVIATEYLLAVAHGALPPKEAEALLRQRMRWLDRNNLLTGSEIFWWCIAEARRVPPHGVTRLAEWKRFWGYLDAAVSGGHVHFQGGDVATRLRTAPEGLTPEDFRLRPDSAGYRTGKGGKDLGADIDLVGPGPAYERWKKTPDYQQWLKETKQTK